MEIRCFYWYSNYKDVSAWQKLQCVPFCLVSLTLYRHLPYLTFFFTLACFMADWLADDILERGKRHSIDNTVQLISKPPTLRVTFLWIFVELINEAYPAQITLHLRWTNASLSLDPLFTWRHGDLFHQWTYLSGKAAYPMYQLTSTRAANREFLVKWIMELYSVLDYFRCCKPWHCLCYKLVRCWRI